jgi:hypothetical protein
MWKTSDWIIQEIGLAIGKKLDLILLLESEVQKPGGLQGDIEYIPFHRDYPARSFQKVLEMTQVLMVLSDEGREIRVTEKPEKGSPRFYSLTKVG